MRRQVCTLITDAIIRQNGRVLLVRQQGPDDPEPLWGLPGGVVEPGELLFEALAREVSEEAGLRILDAGHLAYLVQIGDRHSVGTTLVYAFEISRWEGDPGCADPDGLVSEARFFSIEKALAELAKLPWQSMREPPLAYLSGKAKPEEVWFYRQAEGGEEERAMPSDETSKA